MTGVAQFAYGALERALVVNAQAVPHKNGEIASLEHPWACSGYGRPEHDYFTCPSCKSNYSRHLQRVRS